MISINLRIMSILNLRLNFDYTSVYVFILISELFQFKSENIK